MSGVPPGLDLEALKKLSLTVWSYKQGEMVSLLIHLGDRLGLFRALEGAGPLGAAELAARTGCHERWLLEWLRGCAAARLLDTAEGDRFELSALQAAVLVDEQGSLFFATGAFDGPIDRVVVDRLGEAFRTGIGLSYQELGPCAAHRTERMLGPWTRIALVPKILPALDGVIDKLERGAAVADVGCGAGVAILAMAERFPNSTFHGIDPSRHAIDRAEAKSLAAGLRNVVWQCARGEEVPAQPTFDFVITFDCLHDMTRPDRVIGALRRALHHDGTWLIKDIRSSPRWKDNLKNPLLAMFYGFSISACMSSALSEPDGLGLGTLGFNPEVAERMVRAGGFTRFRQHDFEDPANLYYEVRP